MSDFQGMEELLQDFLTEAGELLGNLDNKLVDLEKTPGDKNLLNDIFRSFHTIKGGAGFLGATELIKLCHLTENLFDKLRSDQLQLNMEIMDVIMAATATVREMFDDLSASVQPGPAAEELLVSLKAAAEGKVTATQTQAKVEAGSQKTEQVAPSSNAKEGPDWNALHASLVGAPIADIAPKQAELTQTRAPSTTASFGRRSADTPGPDAKHGRREADTKATPKDTTIRVDTARLDQVLNLSGEIGLTKNRLSCLRAEILKGHSDSHTLAALDEAVSQLDLLVGNLQSAVMKTRMQPIGRLFSKYPRLGRDLARQLGKDVEIALFGEETEIDKTMIEDLNDPLVHLVRNAVDHGVEIPEQRAAVGKPAKSIVKLEACQEGDHILIKISDDGKGMKPEVLRQKAVEKGLLTADEANSMDDKQSLHLIFLPGFSTKSEISAVSGRGVGMDVVKTNIQKLNGHIDISSVPGKGSVFTISLPLTLAILPVLTVEVSGQAFAVPLSMVREIVTIESHDIQQVSGKVTMVLRGQVLPVKSLASMLGSPISSLPPYGALIQHGDEEFVLAIDRFIGRDDVVIKPLLDIKPHGIAGATLSGDGSIVLILDMEQLLSTNSGEMTWAMCLKAA